MQEKSDVAHIQATISRRRAAIASAVASIAQASAMTSELGSRATPTAQPAGQAPATAALPQLPPNAPKLSQKVRLRRMRGFESILAEYGGRFSDEQKADLRRLCTFGQAPLERLRAYKVRMATAWVVSEAAF